MNCREMMEKDHPSFVGTDDIGGVYGCPDHYGYADTDIEYCKRLMCKECWDREIKEKKE